MMCSRPSRYPRGFAARRPLNRDVRHCNIRCYVGEPSRVGGIPHRCKQGRGHVCPRHPPCPPTVAHVRSPRVACCTRACDHVPGGRSAWPRRPLGHPSPRPAGGAQTRAPLWPCTAGMIADTLWRCQRSVDPLERAGTAQSRAAGRMPSAGRASAGADDAPRRGRDPPTTPRGDAAVARTARRPPNRRTEPIPTGGRHPWAYPTGIRHQGRGSTFWR